jgi:Bacterial PH domain
VTAVDDVAGGAGDARESPRPSGAWSPSGGLVGLAWAAAAAAAAWGVLVATAGDRAGLLIAAVAALGLGLAALFGTRARPRLRVDASGVTVGGLAAQRHHPWSEIGDVRVLTVRRLGRTSTVLEIDVVGPDDDERLLVFSRLDLDDDPVDVAEAVRAVRDGAG